ncbi:unnamed protein product, partial [Urochloa humidicola]
LISFSSTFLSPHLPSKAGSSQARDERGSAAMTPAGTRRPPRPSGGGALHERARTARPHGGGSQGRADGGLGTARASGQRHMGGHGEACGQPAAVAGRGPAVTGAAAERARCLGDACADLCARLELQQVD